MKDCQYEQRQFLSLCGGEVGQISLPRGPVRRMNGGVCGCSEVCILWSGWLRCCQTSATHWLKTWHVSGAKGELLWLL